MASDRQIEANRRNAALSTGPRTSAGKTRSRMNALRHGASSRILFEQQFMMRHQNATRLQGTFEPVYGERALLLQALDAAIASGNKSTVTKNLLRKLQALERRERAIARSTITT